jgi:hypothetical protein
VVITKQSYFLNNSDIIIQNNGLAMGAPSSSITAEIFIQHTENSHLACLTQKHRIVNYFHYVDIPIDFWPKPHEHTGNLWWFQITVHSGTGSGRHSKLFRHIHPQNLHELENLHIQETYVYRHQHPLHSHSSHTTQTHGNRISYAID